jgi:EpsI family protein
LHGAAGEQSFTLEKGGRRVGLFFGIYRDQRQGEELISSLNVLLRTDNPHWISTGSGSRVTEIGGRSLKVRSQRMRGGNSTLVAWQWYWLGGTSTANDASAKLDLALDRLLRRDDTSAWVTVYVLDPPDAEVGDRILDDFVREMSGELDRALRSLVSR